MLKHSKFATFALLWLVLAGVVFAAPVAVTFQKVGHDYPILDAGRFQGTINSGPVFNMFCIDFQNSINDGPYAAFVSDSSDLNKTRYGTTAAANFTYQPPSSTLSALDRYTMAAWLTQQFVFTFSSGSPAPTAADNGIQTAIWTLLAQTPAAPGANPLASTWVNNALTYKSGNPSGFASLQSSMRIITSADVSTTTGDRYHTGQQEFIYIPGNPVPEPGTYLMIGSGLIALALRRRRA